MTIIFYPVIIRQPRRGQERPLTLNEVMRCIDGVNALMVGICGPTVMLIATSDQRNELPLSIVFGSSLIMAHAMFYNKKDSLEMLIAGLVLSTFMIASTMVLINTLASMKYVEKNIATEHYAISSTSATGTIMYAGARLMFKDKAAFDKELDENSTYAGLKFLFGSVAGAALLSLATKYSGEFTGVLIGGIIGAGIMKYLQEMNEENRGAIQIQ